MKPPLRFQWIPAVAILPAFACTLDAQPYLRAFTDQGQKVELAIDHVDPSRPPGQPFEEGENVRVRFKISELTTGMPLQGGSPAAWLDPASPGRTATPQQCLAKVARLAEGSTFSRSDVELTSNYVLTMNADPTIMVIDPRFSFGDSHLLALIPLQSPGEDWAASADGTRIYVSVPKSGAVAVIDANSWKVIANISVRGRPGRVALQPDGAYLWVAFDGAADSGVAAVSTRDLHVAARISTGKGYHHLAFYGDSTFALVTNPGSGTISVVDVRKLAKSEDFETGGSPSWIAWSDLAQAAYATSETDGAIIAIGGAAPRILARMASDSGVQQIGVAPGGRFALAVNPAKDIIYVVDTASNRLIQRGKVGKGGEHPEPDQIAFSSKVAYVRTRRGDSVLMVQLGLLGEEGKELSLADFPGGDHPAGKTSLPTPAAGMVQPAGEDGLLIANPGDEAVYYYMEGAAAPQGNFSTYGREPRAVLEIERNLRERAPGTYETVMKLPSAGEFDLAMMLDKPRLAHCFDLTVAPDPARLAVARQRLTVEPLPFRNTAVAGEEITLRLRIVYAATSQPRPDLDDVTVLMMAPGVWQERRIARHEGEGVYAVRFRPPRGAPYTLHAAAPAEGLEYTPVATMIVTDAPPPADK
jgi:YVTN family beta-propeller protein